MRVAQGKNDGHHGVHDMKISSNKLSVLYDNKISRGVFIIMPDFT